MVESFHFLEWRKFCGHNFFPIYEQNQSNILDGTLIYSILNYLNLESNGTTFRGRRMSKKSSCDSKTSSI